MCMYVRMCVCTYVCVYVHTYVYMYIRMCVYTYNYVVCLCVYLVRNASRRKSLEDQNRTREPISQRYSMAALST